METFQERVSAWIHHAFGPEVASDKTERSWRFLEESLELVQASGVSVEDAQKLVAYVYSRPVGELKQEVGGVMTTLATLCSAHGIDMDKCALDELERVWKKIDVIREKQKNKPHGSPLPGPSVPAPNDLETFMHDSLACMVATRSLLYVIKTKLESLPFDHVYELGRLLADAESHLCKVLPGTFPMRQPRPSFFASMKSEDLQRLASEGVAISISANEELERRGHRDTNPGKNL